VRKFLIASQKGGVGKTTSVINLAAAASLAGARVLLLDADPLSNVSTSLNLGQDPKRSRLRDSGVDVPGFLVRNILPGLDVLSPYEEGGCTDEELGQVLSLVSSSQVKDCYSCLLVNTPPFLGTNPGQLLAVGEEFLLVMRAEPLASRTLPAFLEVVGRAQRQGATAQFRGILLTLPEGEPMGGRWERELRGRFGNRILPHVVPHDPEVVETQLFNRILVHSNPESPAAVSYNLLVETLALAVNLPRHQPDAMQALCAAAATLGTTPPRRPPELVSPPPASAEAAAKEEPKPREKVLSGMRPGDLRRPPERKRPGDHKLPEPAKKPSRPVRLPSAPVSPSGLHNRVKTPAHAPVVDAAKPQPVAPSQKPPASGVNHAMVLLSIGLAVVLGVSLRFLKIPSFMVPVLVGVGVAAVIIAVYRYSLTPTDEGKTPGTNRPPRPDEASPSAPRASESTEASKRRNALPRRVGAPSPHRGRSDN
jgi:chromosome partitioning protein